MIMKCITVDVNLFQLTSVRPCFTERRVSSLELDGFHSKKNKTADLILFLINRGGAFINNIINDQAVNTNTLAI